MKQTYDINNRTQTKSAWANEAAAPPVRPGRVFGLGSRPKAGVIALLLGAGLLTAMGQTSQPHYRFIAITVPVPSEALGINDSGLVTGAYVPLPDDQRALDDALDDLEPPDNQLVTGAV